MYVRGCRHLLHPCCAAQVFDGKTGKLVAKYHKSHIWAGFFDQAKPVRTKFFTFGVEFGMFVCFDMMFHEPAFGMIEDEGVCNFVYTTWWSPQRPLFSAVALQQAFSARYRGRSYQVHVDGQTHGRQHRRFSSTNTHAHTHSQGNAAHTPGTR